MGERQNKILWVYLNSALKQDIKSRKLKDPTIRLGAIERIDVLMRNHFNNIYRNPIELLNIEKTKFINNIGSFKPEGALNDAEISIVNNIYEYLKKNN